MPGTKFMFCTGIENSYPNIILPDGTRKRIADPRALPETDAEQRPDHRTRPGAPGRDGKMRALQILGNRFFVGKRAGHRLPEIWAATL